MKIQIERRLPLPGIPSASGIEATPQGIFVIGDDAPWLYRLDADYRIVERIRIHPAQPATDTGRIPRQIKPDFEALASRTTASGLELFAFGSGSKLQTREVLAQVGTGSPGGVWLRDLSVYYAAIRRAAELGNNVLNIEAAVIHGGKLYLFDRGSNVVACCPLDALIAHVDARSPCPEPQIHRRTLPTLEGREAGFSGATLLPGTDSILFTASVELTDDWNADGKVVGSFLGILRLPLTARGSDVSCEVLRERDGSVLPVKLESVAVLSHTLPSACRLLLVTDSDDGASELIEATIDLQA